MSPQNMNFLWYLFKIKNNAVTVDDMLQISHDYFDTLSTQAVNLLKYSYLLGLLQIHLLGM